MTEEFNLSDKETVYCLYKREDVKEFIKRLKVFIQKLKRPIEEDKSSGEYRLLEALYNEIDNLAGDKLI